MGSVIGAAVVAATLLLMLGLALRALRAQARAEKAIKFERELAGDLLEQAAAFDRLVAALAGIADDLDEGHVLRRAANEACRLVHAEIGVVLELGQDGALEVAAGSGEGLTLPEQLVSAAPESVAAQLARTFGGYAHATPLGAPSLELGLLAVVRPTSRFSPLELAQLRVLADFSARAAQNARLFALAESLRDEAEERERERARLSDRLLHAEENERRRLALALHDGPQQTISGIALMVQAACDALDAEDVPDARRILALALDRNRNVVRSLRQLQFSLEPITLRDHGFSAAFGELAAQRSEEHGLEVVVDGAAIDALDPTLQVALYRIAQEALANAVKHAAARRIEVRSTRGADLGLELVVSDDGVGATTLDLARGGLHRGVDSMRERAAGLAATLTFESTPGGGCTVRVQVPAASLELAGSQAA
jgi:two-component system sensor histidine kinase UhpB